jgi:hypothetical protein
VGVKSFLDSARHFSLLTTSTRVVMKSLSEHPIGSILTVIRPQSWLGSRKQALLALRLLFAVHWVIAKNPKDNFCRRFAHQTTVIDDKLYIDGGWVNFDDFQQTHANYSSKSARQETNIKWSDETLANPLIKIPGWDITISISL